MEKVKQRLKLLQDSVFYAEEHHHIWMALEYSRHHNKELYLEFGNFLESSRRAHFVSMLLAVCAIFDTTENCGLGRYYVDNDTKQVCYGKFINRIEEHSIINKRTIRKIKTILKQKQVLIKKARTLRDKNFAHAELDIDSVLKRERLTKKSSASLVKIAGKLVNEVSRACGVSSSDPAPSSGREALFRLLGDQETN